MANWFYIAGSLCFLVGTIINMATTEKPQMRDIEEIKHINENPRAARSEDELFKTMSGRRIEITRRLHGERVEARQAQQS